MDDLDIAIFREMCSGNRIGPLSIKVKVSQRLIARKLGVDNVTVSNRLRRLFDGGYLKRFVIPNPALFRQRAGQVWLNVSPASFKDDAVRKIAHVPGVVAISKCFGNQLSVVFFYGENEPKRMMPESIAHICKSSDAFTLEIPLPKPAFRPGGLDWKLIHALQENPNEKYSEIARELKSSTRTVRRELARLEGGNIIFSVNWLETKFLKEQIVAGMMFSYTRPELKGKVDQAIEDGFGSFVLWEQLGDPCGGYLQLAVPRMLDLEHIRQWTKQLSGVADVRVVVEEECMRLIEMARDKQVQSFQKLVSAEQTTP